MENVLEEALCTRHPIYQYIILFDLHNNLD